MANTVYDIDILGELDSQGQIKEYFGKEAIENSIVVWLTSFNTDVLRNPSHGGYITRHLSKPMTPSTQEDLHDAIVDGFNQDYELYVDLINLDVTPDFENKAWRIDILASVPDIEGTITVSSLIKNFV